VGRNPFLSFSFESFFKKVSTITKIFLETLQKVSKIVDIHLFENVAFRKKFACVLKTTKQNKLVDFSVRI